MLMKEQFELLQKVIDMFDKEIERRIKDGSFERDFLEYIKDFADVREICEGTSKDFLTAPDAKDREEPQTQNENAFK